MGRRPGTVSTSSLRRWAPWLAMLVVVVLTLAAGTIGGDRPTDQERAQNLAGDIRCPQCASQSVANSETPSAKGVKVVIADRIAAGNTDEEIRDFIASRYGRDVLLDPSGKGFGALVWSLPVVGAVIAVGALAIRFRDWRPADGTASDADRHLVADALGRDERGAGTDAGAKG